MVGVGVGKLVVQVDDIVGDGVARSVDLLRDVETLAAEESGDLSEDAGHVLVDDANSREALAGSLNGGGREVNRVADRASLEEVNDLLSSHPRAIVLGLLSS